MAEEKKPKDIKGSILDHPLDKGTLAINFDPAELGMAAVSADFLIPGEKSPADFFLALFDKGTRKVEMMPACRKGDIFREKWRERLRRTEQKKLYVSLNDAYSFNKYMEKASFALIDDPRATRSKKASLIVEMANLNMQMLFGSDLTAKNLENAVEMAAGIVDSLTRNPPLLTTVSELLKNDFSVYSHSVNTCMLAMAFGRYLKISEAQTNALGVGGMLHDVGMAKLPKEIVNKKGPLTPGEKALIREHPQLGYDLLKPVSMITHNVLMLTLHHHENADGSGYPHRLKADHIPYLARLLRVVDSYDAMTSNRPYHDPMVPFEAAKLVVEARTNLFGEDIVPSFVRFLGGQYVGALQQR